MPESCSIRIQSRQHFAAPGRLIEQGVHLPDGSRLGVRAPMHESEAPVVRPYVLVSDIGAAVQAAGNAGGEIAHPPMELAGQGTFAIFTLGGIHHGLWQL